jgi:hypothetical protein
MSIPFELKDAHYQHGQVNGLAGITLSSVSACQCFMRSGNFPEYLIPLAKGCFHVCQMPAAQVAAALSSSKLRPAYPRHFY